MTALQPRTAAWLYTAVVGGLASYFLVDIPVQLSDSLQNIFAADRRTLRELFVNNLWSDGYLRPLLFAPIRLVYLVADGNYTAWFRGVHAVQLTLTIAALVAALRVRTWAQASAVPLAVAMLLSIHTSADTIREAFPVNAYLTIVLCCVLTVLLASAPHRWWSDAAAFLLLAVAALSVESGLLVGVIVVAGYVAGWRGVSRWGVAAAVAGVAAYFAVRFLVFDVGTPGLDERATGFGFAILEPDEIQARFGASPLPLFAYNVLASVGTVLFAEPRAGVFWMVRQLVHGELEPWVAVNFVACTSVTVLLAAHIAAGWARWRRWQLADADRMIVVFIAVLAGNAAMNLVYTKDVIMSPAGALFALSAAGALAARLDGGGSVRVSPAAAALVAAVALTWGIKTMGVHYSLRDSAHATRKAWVYADSWLEAQEVSLAGPRERGIKDALMADALWRRPASPRIQIHWRWPGAWFDTTQ
ncbi:MAG: hypothetical protein AB7I25_01610 [Vicinamibacterales bacterium]